jgi:hypothetical protein
LAGNEEVATPHFLGYTRLYCSNITTVLGSFLTMEFFNPKFMKIRCYLEIFTTFGTDFKTKSTIYKSIFIHRFKGCNYFSGMGP